MSARFLLASFVLVLVSACGGESGPGGGGGLATVDVTPDAAELFSAAPGNTVKLTVVGRDDDGQPVSGGDLGFTTSAPAVATVAEDGTVTGVGPGMAQITASITLGGATATGTTQVTVEAASATATVTAPQTLFSPRVVDIAAGGAVTWTIAAVQHDVDFTSAGAPSDIPPIQNTSASRTFASSGIFPYRCNLHAGMTGEVRVH